MYIDSRSDPASSMFQKPILLPPGAYSSLSFEPRELRIRKSTPNCFDDDEEKDGGGIRERHPWMVLNSPAYYRQDLCKFDCLLQSIIDACRCLLLIDGRYVNRSALFVERHINNNSDNTDQQQQSPTSSPYFQIGYCTSEQIHECANDILHQFDSPNSNEFNANNCTRRCRPSCRRKEYRLVSNTYLKLPAENYLGSGPNYPYPWNELKNNYVIVDVVLERGQTVLIDERPAVNLETFLGIAGGQMSLFLGCSVLTIIQAAVIFLSCCKSQCQRIYRGKCLTVRKTLRKMRHSSLLK